MSTLKINTLSNLAGSQSTPVENAINGSAKAWVNFNGTGAVAIRVSYNVSSLVDNGVGIYTVNFTNALTDSNYVVTGGFGDTFFTRTQSKANGSYQAILTNRSGTESDHANCEYAIFR